METMAGDVGREWSRFWSERVYYQRDVYGRYNQTYWPLVSEMERFYGDRAHSVLWAFSHGYGLWFACFPIAALYVLCIFGIQAWMRDRPRYELRGPLALWNAHLALFSLVGTLRVTPEMVDLFTEHGFKRGLYMSMCTTRFAYGDVGVWTLFFMLSKVYEMGDTIFIVLRKQNLIFLHWYHHVATMFYVWFVFVAHQAPARWFYVMNFAIHTIMYTYFALKALKVRVPRSVSMVITSLQLLQMFVGSYVCGQVLYHKLNDVRCEASVFGMVSCLGMYLSYCLLFGHFFYRSYITSHRKAAAAAAAKAKAAADTGVAANGNGVATAVNGIDGGLSATLAKITKAKREHEKQS